jgi:succinate dehydrogenase/fumarate reductase flavoprotein subunit
MARDDMHVDVLVVGTGASGMAAAVAAAHEGLDVLVVEKQARYGGTTARSGGWLWIPGTHLASEQGIQEPAGAAQARCWMRMASRSKASIRSVMMQPA